jgi:CHAD domain-containing protein
MTPDTVKKMEIELKLTLPPDGAEAAIVELMRSHNYSLTRLKTQTNTDTYMDTGDWSLLKNGLTLRYRVNDNQAIYTLKGTGDIKDGIARRAETEIELEKPVRAPTDIPVKELKKEVKGIIFPGRLIEHIVIRTKRRNYLAVTPEGARLTLSFDTSSFAADALYQARPAQELHVFEAEIMEGTETALDALAGLLSQTLNFPPAATSKLETAMQRLCVEPLVKKTPPELMVGLDDRLDIALKKMLSVEFAWLQRQLPGAMTDRDPEFVHQARVTTRRMRSALLLFHGALPEETVAYLEQRLKWLGSLLGGVRDLDVFIINIDKGKNSIESFSKAGRQALKRLVVKQRRSPLRSLSQALKSRRYKNFERRMKQSLASSPADAPELPQAAEPVRRAAPRYIKAQFQNIMEQSKKTLENPDPARFHALRIQMKRFRYLVEFMSHPYGHALDEVIARATEVQDCLGEMQDTVFHQKIIKQIMKDSRSKLVDAKLLFALGEIYQLQGDIADSAAAVRRYMAALLFRPIGRNTGKHPGRAAGRRGPGRIRCI